MEPWRKASQITRKAKAKQFIFKHKNRLPLAPNTKQSSAIWQINFEYGLSMVHEGIECTALQLLQFSSLFPITRTISVFLPFYLLPLMIFINGKHVEQWAKLNNKSKQQSQVQQLKVFTLFSSISISKQKSTKMKVNQKSDRCRRTFECNWARGRPQYLITLAQLQIES